MIFFFSDDFIMVPAPCKLMQLSKESQNYLKGKKKHLPLKSALKDFKITDDEPDFTKLFKK